nr:ARID DNA-binding domain-containing protein [Tanacetum cinerariifolium]
MQGIVATKPTVLITYPETVHFSTTCMIKGTDLTGWDEIWDVSNKIDRHVCYKLDAFCNMNEEFSVTKSTLNLYQRNEKDWSKIQSESKGIFTLQRSLPGTIPPIINGVEIHLFYLYKIMENLGGYLSVHFSQEFDMVGEIMGLSKGNGEEIRKCYMNFLEILTSHFKTARAPRQGNMDTMLEPARRDRECLCITKGKLVKMVHNGGGLQSSKEK